MNSLLSEFLSEGESSCQWFCVLAVRDGLRSENLLVGEEDVLEVARPEVTERFFHVLQSVLLGLVRQCVPAVIGKNEVQVSISQCSGHFHKRYPGQKRSR